MEDPMDSNKTDQIRTVNFYGKETFENRLAEKGLLSGNLCCRVDPNTGEIEECKRIKNNQKYERNLSKNLGDNGLKARQMRIDANETFNKLVVKTQGKMKLSNADICPVALMHAVFATNLSIGCGVSRCALFVPNGKKKE